MAEGWGFENPSFDPDDVDPADWDDDNDDDDGQTLNETTPFVPGGSSTPGPQGQDIEMQTTQHEQSGLPQKSYTETSFGATKSSAEAWETAKNLFPNMSSSELDVFYTPKGRLQVKMFGQGKKAYDMFTTKRGTNEQQLNPKLTKEIKNALGDSSFKLFGEAKQQLAENQKQLKEKQKELKQTESMAKQTEKVKNDMEEITNQMRQIDEQRTALEDTHGQLNKEKIEKLKQQKDGLQKEHQEKRKQFHQLRKTAKNASKLKEDIQKLTEENARLNKTTGELQEKINTEYLKEKKERKTELEQQIAELKRQKEEEIVIIDDEETSPSDKAAAEERMAEIDDGIAQREDELARLVPQIEERERAMSPREKIKRFFKILGVTLASITLAAGVAISAVFNTITKNALKAMGNGLKKLGNGLKEIGKKVASILPGLIGSIASFHFKAAGQAIGFLAEHTWLLILAVVAFLIESYVKKQR